MSAAAGRQGGGGAFVSGERVILAGILGVGTLLRLYRLDLTWYFLDQVRDVAAATAIASGASFPLLGPLVGWTHGRLGPLYFYLIAPPFVLSGAPLAGVAFVALANALAIFLLYRLARDLFGSGVALAAAACFAVFPLAVLSSRVLWNPALIPLFTVLFLRALFAVVVGRRSRAIIGAFASLAVLTQLHLTTVSLGVVALVALAVWRPRLELAHVLAGAGVFLALYAPYLVHEIGHGFENTRAILRVATVDPGAGGERAFLGVVRNLLMLDRPVLDGFVVAEPWPPAFLEAFSLLYGVEAVLFGVGLLVCLGRLVRGSGPPATAAAAAAAARRAVGLLLLSLLVPVVMLGTRKTALWWYYFDLLYPGQFIVVGIAVSALAAPGFGPARARRILLGAAAGTVLAIVAGQTWFQIGLQQRIDRQAEIVLEVPRLSVASAPSSLGTLSFLPYRYRERILRTLLDDFGMQADAFSGHVHGPVLGLAAENDDLLRHLAGRIRAGPTPSAAPAHYLVTRGGDAAVPSSASRSARVGPYLVAEYRPAIDYQGWSHALLLRAPGDGVAEGRWQPGRLPAARIVAAPGEGQVLAWRGRLVAAGPDRPVTVTVSVIAEAPSEVFRLESGGRRLVPLSRRSWSSPSLYSTTEAVLDVTGPAAASDGSIAFAVAGGGRVMRVDVYERGGKDDAPPVPGKRP